MDGFSSLRLQAAQYFCQSNSRVPANRGYAMGFTEMQVWVNWRPKKRWKEEKVNNLALRVNFGSWDLKWIWLNRKKLLFGEYLSKTAPSGLWNTTQCILAYCPQEQVAWKKRRDARIVSICGMIKQRARKWKSEQGLTSIAYTRCVRSVCERAIYQVNLIYKITVELGSQQDNSRN
jgi:hypothetical protein